MKLGCTIPLSLLCDAVLPPDLAALAPKDDRQALLISLYTHGVRSIELHGIDRHTDPAALRQAVTVCENHGFSVTLHGTLIQDEPPSVFFAPYRALFTPSQPCYTVTLHGLSEADTTCKQLCALSAYAESERLSVAFVLENDHKDSLQNAADHCGGVWEIVSGTDNIGICWDMGHYYHNVLCGYEAGDLPSDPFLQRVRHTHIHAVGNGEMHLPFSQGELPLKRYLEALRTVRFDGVLNVELSPARFYRNGNAFEAYLSAVDTLRNTVERVR